MSLNGDVVVMRNGRSTSQVSIYNYPEHLNPFYEDDQHKRLRFWQINKKGDGNGRRSSFSLSGLKDVWAFKSFRLKKKSSTLGINKTSESPPPLRRDFQYISPAQNGLNTYDRRTRYSSNASPANDNFPRNAVYRSSLQNMYTAQGSPGLGLNRNDQYRKTIQTVNNAQQRSLPVPQPRRYVYGGSVTPQPLRSSEFGRGESRDALTRGSSQTSVASTNPFESDYEDDNEDIQSNCSQMTGSTPVKRTPRKKRRAPAPPAVPIHKVNNGEISVTTTESSQQNSQRLEDSYAEENNEIANLTAEIESFVKTTSHETPEREVPTISIVPCTPEQEPTIKQNGAIPKEITKTETVTTTTTVKTSITEPKTTDEDKRVNQTTRETTSPVPTVRKIVQKPSEQEHKVSEQQTKAPEVGHVECIHVHVESPRSTPERTEASRMSSFQAEQKQANGEPVTTKTSFTLTNPPVTARGNGIVTTEQITVTTQRNNISAASTPKNSAEERQVNELKITEEPPTYAAATKNTHSSPPSVVKPAIAAKPVLEVRTKVSSLAEIHRPTRGIDVRAEALSTNTTETKTATHAEDKHATKVLTPTASLKAVSPPVLPTSVEPLKITESEDLPNATSSQVPTAVSVAPQPPTRTARNREDEFDALYRPKPSSHLEWKQSTLAPLEPNVPAGKRKSVKDIIESINRSQRLLHAAAHKDQPYSLTATSDGEYEREERLGNTTPLMRRKLSEPNNNFDQNLKSLDESQREIKRMFEEIAVMENAAGGGDGAVNGHNGDEPLNNNGGGGDQQKLDNDEIFKKCKVTKEVYDYRETSPTASNLDWNPVPKPKRTKNMHEI